MYVCLYVCVYVWMNINICMCGKGQSSYQWIQWTEKKIWLSEQNHFNSVTWNINSLIVKSRGSAVIDIDVTNKQTLERLSYSTSSYKKVKGIVQNILSHCNRWLSVIANIRNTREQQELLVVISGFPLFWEPYQRCSVLSSIVHDIFDSGFHHLHTFQNFPLQSSSFLVTNIDPEQITGNESERDFFFWMPLHLGPSVAAPTEEPFQAS